MIATMTVTLAGANSPGEHLQLALFTTASAVLFIWLGRRQRRTGRSFAMPDRTISVGGALVPPQPPRRVHRITGCAAIVFGGIFVLPAVYNFVAAVYELLN
ncbi:hypothetical protein ACH4TV_16630 [Streptomyces sp. NPDC020898]|uniref:hypothetical protein n=1 Tax=Streptomyces sp. NPDC020898 TaxID=3365101 RepID=UPI0037940ECA